jgi:hypothetical protein
MEKKRLTRASILVIDLRAVFHCKGIHVFSPVGLYKSYEGACSAGDSPCIVQDVAAWRYAGSGLL